MALLFQKFQEAVRTLAKSPTFAKDPRRLQFEADINRLFLYTSYNRLGRDAEETDAEEIIDMASKASLADQQNQVQENIHTQIHNFCKRMDKVLLPGDTMSTNGCAGLASQKPSVRSGLRLAVGKMRPSINKPAIPETRPLKVDELSKELKILMGYTLKLKSSLIPHEEAGQGLFIDGQAEVGTVIALYPGIVYSPAYYCYIPGYPRVDLQNPYLITRYDGTVINAQPWGIGGANREVWDPSTTFQFNPISQSARKGSDRMWKMLSKPIKLSRKVNLSDVLERRNPLALAHFANHPSKGMVPNVMVCPYDFPLTENANDMRAYIPNIQFGHEEEVKMKRFGSFWFKGWGSGSSEINLPILKTVVLVATKAICDEEVLLNYRLSNSKRRPSWYTPVDEEEDRRRWG